MLRVVGGLGGLVGALLSGGTGAVTVPLLDRLTGLRRAVIHATVTIPNVAVAAIGSTIYGLHGGAVDLRIGVPMMLGGVLGVQGGVCFVARAPAKLLRAIFITVLIAAGLKLLLDGLDLLGTPAAPSTALIGNQYLAVAAAFVLGVVVGAWSAAMGLGGGLLTVPMLVLFFGTGMQTALGTSLIVMLPNSLLSAYAHVRRGTALPATGFSLAVGALPGALIGALIALALPSAALNLIFGSFMLFIAATELLRRRARLERHRER